MWQKTGQVAVTECQVPVYQLPADYLPPVRDYKHLMSIKIRGNIKKPEMYSTSVGCGAASCAEGTGGNISTGGLSWPKGYFCSIA